MEENISIEDLDRKIDFLIKLLGNNISKNEETSLFQDLVVFSELYNAPKTARTAEELSKKIEYLTVIYCCVLFEKKPFDLFKALYFIKRRTNKYDKDILELVRLFHFSEKYFEDAELNNENKQA